MLTMAGFGFLGRVSGLYSGLERLDLPSRDPVLPPKPRVRGYGVRVIGL